MPIRVGTCLHSSVTDPPHHFIHHGHLLVTLRLLGIASVHSNNKVIYRPDCFHIFLPRTLVFGTVEDRERTTTDSNHCFVSLTSWISRKPILIEHPTLIKTEDIFTDPFRGLRPFYNGSAPIFIWSKSFRRFYLHILPPISK